MEGHSLDECITEQQRLNDRHQRGKRQYDTQEWDEEWDESQAKAARIDTVQTTRSTTALRLVDQMMPMTRQRKVTMPSWNDGTACLESRRPLRTTCSFRGE
jgi:hypothetical protein